MPELSLTTARHIDEVCSRFETALQARQAVQIESYLGDAAEPMRSALLRELVRLEIDYRVRRGDQPTVAEYRSRFPTHADAIASWFPSEPTIGCTSVEKAAPTWPTVPGYEIIAELGRGGMGLVYHAKHVKFDRMVALKMILAGEHDGAEHTARFLTEARAVARLTHPNIVQIYEIGEHKELPYFSLEYINGGNLAEKLRHAPPSDMEAARLVELLARTVHYAHGRDIVHRDLKPANILLTQDGLPKVADFGLAKILGEDHGATHTGAVIGTASYMAPEQATGKIRDIGPAVDIYALGAILYELLTGRPPFRGETVLATLRQVEEQPPVPPHVLNPRVDRALEAISLKCLQKTPADRYPTADALAADLAAFQRGESPQGHSSTATRLVGALLRESRYTELMALWSRAIMANAVCYFLCSVAYFLLAVNSVEQYAPYFAILVVKMATDVASAWWFRIRGGPPFSHVEHQLLRLFVAFWMLIFFTMWQYQRSRGSIADFGPIIVFETAFAFTCAGIVLGGSFYPTALVLGGFAILGVAWPDVGLVVSSIGCAPALFWVGWKHWRRSIGR